MYPSSELAHLLHQDRAKAADRSRLARLVECASACCSVSATIIDQLVRAMRPAPLPGGLR